MNPERRYPDWFTQVHGPGNPQLALVVWPRYPEKIFFQRDQKPDILPDREWWFLDHQTAGVCCHQRSFWATRVEPKPMVLEGMRLIEKRWFGTDLGRGPSLSACIEYDASLRNLFGPDVRCESDFSYLEEGLYPIDLTPRSIGSLAADNTPSTLDAFRYHGTEHYHPRVLKLFIIGANSD